MKACSIGIALLAALTTSSAHATTTRVEDFGSCLGGCVDTWKVQCSSSETHRIDARVADIFDGHPNVVGVETMGFVGPAALFGRSDREVSGSQSGTFSSPAFLARPGTTHGPTSGMVLVSQVSGDVAGYLVEFACRDAVGAEVGEPNVKLIKDH